MSHPVHDYARAHADDPRLCRMERLALLRHLTDLDRVGAPDFPYVFDDTRAQRILDWYGKVCTHTRGPFSGRHIDLLDWQRFQKGCLFGWVHRESGARRFTKSFDLRARGNAKSAEASADALYLMAADVWYPPGRPEREHWRFEASPEVACAAVDRGQAKRVWGDAREMALNSPLILKHLTVKETYIKHTDRGGELKALSRDTRNKSGGAPTGVILDEYHEAPTSIIHDRLWNSFGKRAQSLMEIISTAGDSADTSPCFREYELCRTVLELSVGAQADPAARASFDYYFVMIRELEPGDDVHDPEVWPKSNPLLRHDDEYSRKLRDQIKSEHDAAYSVTDAIAIREWLMRRTNQWQRGSEEHYFTEACAAAWAECEVPPETLDAHVNGLDAWMGGDLSKRIDLTGAVLVWPLSDGRVAVRAMGFMPRNGLDKHEKTDRVPYSQWAADGWLIVTPGDVMEYDTVQAWPERAIAAVGGRVQEWCLDPANALQLTQAIQRKYGDDAVIDIRQGVLTLNAPTKLFRELVLQRRIVHDGNPLLLHHLMNALEYRDGNGNIKLIKRTKDDTRRIDLAAALMNAMVRVQVQQPESSNLDDLFF